MLLTKSTLTDSATAWAQGGIAAALGADDDPRLHAADTLAASDGLANPDAVQILTSEGPDRVRELVELGVAFDRGPHGFRLALEAAHSRARVLHGGGDRTGAVLVSSLSSRVARHPLIELHEHTEVARLIVEGGRVAGVVAVQAGERPFALLGPAVVLATGGMGQLYARTTNPRVATGDGWALAARAGAELSHLEFLQFHPTAVHLTGVNPAPLISEAVRGTGAVLVDARGERFLAAVDQRAELAPRDVVARAVAAATGGAWLDARRVAHFARQFPGITAMLLSHGLDPARDPIPVSPALHYAMGGVRTSLDGRTTRPGLWAVGEVACTGAHGANRLASNSLLEAIVFADRAARAVAHQIGSPVRARAPASLGELADPDADDRHAAIRRAMRELMTANVGVERSERTLDRAERHLAILTAQVPRTAWRTRHQLLVARLIAAAARRRRETRGGHARSDYPRAQPSPAGVAS